MSTTKLVGRLLCLIGFHRMSDPKPIWTRGQRIWRFCERSGCYAFHTRTEHRR